MDGNDKELLNYGLGNVTWWGYSPAFNIIEDTDQPGKLKSIDQWLISGSAISNGREPRSCLGRVFNIKLGSLVSKQLNCIAHTHSHF